MENHANITYDLDGSVEALQTLSIGISSLGVVANAALFYIFIVDSYFRKIIYYLMLLCCFTDLVSNTLILIIYSVFLTTNIKLSVASTICRTFSFIVYASYSISILNLSLIAAFRYLSVVRPFSDLYLIYKNQFIIISEIIIWLVSIAVGIPDFIHIEARQNKRIICDYSEITNNVSIYLIMYVIINYIIPSVIIIILYWRIIVHQRNYSRPGQPSVIDRRNVDKKDKLVKSLIYISAFYILSTWPFFAWLIAIAITQQTLLDIAFQSEAYFWLSMFSISTTAVIAVINPFLCIKFDENIRRRLKNRLLSRFRFFNLVNNKVTSTVIYPSSAN